MPISQTFAYPFDPSGTLSSNLIQGERQVISPPNWSDYYFIVPLSGPYFRESLQVVHHPSGKILVEGVDYSATHRFHDASLACGKPIYGSITFFDKTLAGMVELRYQTIGGAWTISSEVITEILSNKLINPRRTTWEQIVDLPFQFPVVDHEWNLVDMVGASQVVTSIYAIRDAIIASGEGGLDEHLADTNNPHQVTKSQVGLGNVQNYAVATVAEAQAGASTTTYMTPLRTAQAITALVGNALNAHKADYNNPHQVTAVQVGLGNVGNYAVATQAEAEAGTVNTKYMTPARTKDAITAQTAAFTTHLAATNNPHNTTKAQVGLSSVANYPVADAVEARAGTANDRYMTPAMVREAIAAQSGGDLINHINDISNPHNVTKDQVGLANVQDYPVANSPEAQAGTSNSLYMTPLRTKEAVQALVGTQLTDHINNTANPHNTTKAHVGLSNVENFPIATQAQAEAGTSDAVYMTALKTAQAIAALANDTGDSIAAHASNLNNPHFVTKGQVGLGSVDNFATATQLEAETGTAADRFMTPLATAQLIAVSVSQDLADFIARTDNPHAVTAAQVSAYTKAETDALLNGKVSNGGTIANATRVGGYLATDLLERYTYAAINPLTVEGVTTNAGTTWTKLGSFTITLPADPNNPLVDLAFLLSGGEARAETEAPVYMVRHSMRDMSKFSVEQLAGAVNETQFGYTYNAGTGAYALYVRSAPKRNAIGISVISQPDTLFNNPGPPVDAAPAGLQYATSFTYVGVDPNDDANPGELTFGRNALMTDEFEPGTMVEWINVAEDADEVLEAQALVSDLKEDYHDWLYTSAYGRQNRNAVKNDLKNWGYDPVMGALKRDPTSTSLVMLRSPQHYINYTFEVELSSTDTADMALGVCVAFVRKEGKDHGIYALRTPGGLVLQSGGGSLPGGDIYKLLSVGYNLLQDGAIDLGSTSTGLIWGDGVPDSGRVAAGAFQSAFNGWDDNGVCRIRVTRSGNMITIMTSQLNATDVNAGATVTIDLTSRPELAVFLGPTTWGVVGYAQAACRFKLINRPDKFQPYVDYKKDVNGLDISTINHHNGSVWVSQPMNIESNFIKPGRQYYSDFNGRVYFARRDGTLRPMYIEAFTREDTTVLTA